MQITKTVDEFVQADYVIDFYETKGQCTNYYINDSINIIFSQAEKGGGDADNSQESQI